LVIIYFVDIYADTKVDQWWVRSHTWVS